MLTGFGDIGRLFSKICTETFKRNVHNPKRRRPCFQKMKNCSFNNWYCISQIQDLKPNIKRSFRQIAQPKRDSAFEQKKHVLFQVERCEEVLKTDFLITNKEKSRAQLKKTIPERNQRRFGKFLFCSRNRAVYKYSISQDISNAGCKEPKYQT